MHNPEFYTLTDADTQYTNSRSERFPSMPAALEAARKRIANHAVHSIRPHPGVYILKAIAFVEPEPTPNIIITPTVKQQS